jgi:GntR family transcriptional regulator
MTERPTATQLDVVLDRTSPVPLYHQLAQAIEAAINEGTLNPGDRLENELSLTTRLGLARPTARQAIQELVKKGLLVRKRGVGTQVVHSQINRDAKLTSLYEDLQRSGNLPSTSVLEITSGELAAEVRATLSQDIDLQGEFTRIRRLRSTDGTPLAILTNHLPTRLELTEAELEKHGLYELLRSRGVNMRIAHQTIGSRLLTDDEAALLDETPPAACLTVERVVYDDTGRLVEVGQHVYRASLYKMHTSLVS